MEEVSDRCCRPHRPTSRREEGRESPPTREGSGLLGATDPDHAGGAKQPNTILTARAISPPPPTEHDERPRKRTRDPPHPGKEEGRVRKEEEFGGIRRRRRRRRKKTRKRAKAPLRVRPLGTRHSRRLERSIVERGGLGTRCTRQVSNQRAVGRPRVARCLDRSANAGEDVLGR